MSYMTYDDERTLRRNLMLMRCYPVNMIRTPHTSVYEYFYLCILMTVNDLVSRNVDRASLLQLAEVATFSLRTPEHQTLTNILWDHPEYDNRFIKNILGFYAVSGRK